ncbi:MAG: class I SAM-dependent methyltransferase [Gammaproteobacteria bacterium]|nr:class I SAM-dependent methyltransferase [Gammaproteobacteria bacterium]
MSLNCNICAQPLANPIYTSPNNKSITSLCKILDHSSSVYFCNNCAHTYTPPLNNLSNYYAEDYTILVDSEEEDQLVSFPSGEKKFRFKLQVDLFLDKVSPPTSSKILDYGCAKSTTLKKIHENRTDIIPHLFDVSDNYISFWEKFATSKNWATFTIPKKWDNYFDVITSFFSLEHVLSPDLMVETIYKLLKDKGIFYCVIPNMYVNTADFIVADHINHFSTSSARYLLEKHGLRIIEIDDKSHYGALTITAIKDKRTTSSPINNQKQTEQQLQEIVHYWKHLEEKIILLEEENGHYNDAAIYGSGFYGTYIFSCLKNIEKIDSFIDNNEFRQKKRFLGKSIISPASLPNSIKLIYVGLNPIVAKDIIDKTEDFNDKEFIFL